MTHCDPQNALAPALAPALALASASAAAPATSSSTQTKGDAGSRAVLGNGISARGKVGAESLGSCNHTAGRADSQVGSAGPRQIIVYVERLVGGCILLTPQHWRPATSMATIHTDEQRRTYMRDYQRARRERLRQQVSTKEVYGL